jgi:hypothetical protein
VKGSDPSAAPLRPGVRPLSVPRRLLAPLLFFAALSGCVAVNYPRAGATLDVPAGHSLVFGHIALSADGQDLRPFSSTGAVPPHVGPALHLWLLRLGPRRISPALAVEPDGSFWWTFEPGDYALIVNTHEVSSAEASDLDRQDMQVLALLRVPESAAAYAGDLELRAAHVSIDTRLQMQYDLAGATVVDRYAARTAELAARFPGTRLAPVPSLMCAGPGMPAFDDADLFDHGRAMLDGGCRD